MAILRHTLHLEVFRPSDERLLELVHVTKASKKKKTSFLCAVVTTDKPIRATIYQVKKSDKDIYKKKNSWALRELKLVDGKELNKETTEFDLHFEKVYKWVASSVQERNAFLVCLWKLCCQHLPRQKPNFANIPEELLEDSVAMNELSTHPSGEDSVLEAEDYQAVTEREEQDLEMLMAECEFAISKADAFTEQLSRDLSLLDGANIHTIMASEAQVLQLMEMIKAAYDDATHIEDYLDSYDDIIKNVQSNIEKMEEKNGLIQIQNSNNVKLLKELDHLVSQLDLSHEHQVVLINDELTSSRNISNCLTAAQALQKAQSVSIHPALSKMKAVKEQQKLLEKLRIKFAQRLSRHLNNLFIHVGNEMETLSLHAQELTLPKHYTCHRDLAVYAELMLWLKQVDYESYSKLAKIYTSSLSRLYEREIKCFIDNAKQRISGRTEKDRKGKATDSSQELGAKPLGRVRSSSLLGSDKEQFGSELDITEWQKFDKLLERMLSELEPVCLAEQKFCVQFFHLASDTNQTSTTTSVITQKTAASQLPTTNVVRTTSEEDLLASQRKEKQINEEVRRMMGELFAVLEPELMNFIANYDKVDGFYSMYLLVRLSQHVMSAQDTGSFLSMTFATALVQAKRNFDTFMKTQIKSIEDAKVYKKSRCGILPFVSNFEDFAQQAEAIFKGSERRTDLDKWYVKLVHAMFEAIPRIAKEHLKTPPEVVKMENFHHLHALLSQLKITCLENERKEVKQKYNEHLQAYVTQYFGRPLDKLNIFFDGVQSKVQQGIKEEEVGYQMAYSKQELRKVIREYPGKEVKKGLESLYKKVDKHLCDEENLLQVVWHSMQDEFIRQYKYIEALIDRCYPGSMITLEFTIQDILQFFSDIARSH